MHDAKRSVICHYHVVRFRQTETRLQVSLVETRRVDGRVRHEHIASFGSVEWPLSVEGRMAFWQRVHERLATLANRVDPAAHAKALGEIYARVPMVTPDEQRALQLENAKADAIFWDSLADGHGSIAEAHEGLAAVAERTAATSEVERATAAEHAARARDRIARIEHGEDVPGGLGKPLTLEDAERIMRQAGMTTSAIRHCVQVADVSEAIGFETLLKAIFDAKDRAERNVVRRLDRAHRRQYR